VLPGFFGLKTASTAVTAGICRCQSRMETARASPCRDPSEAFTLPARVLFVRHLQDNRCFGPVRRFGTNDIDMRLWLTYSVHMHEIGFVWDERKNRDNQRKHGVAFEEAQTAFLDENAKIYADPDHSEDEDRFILLGISFRLRTLVVCHCYREKESVIRIISARKADRSEQGDYWS